MPELPSTGAIARQIAALRSGQLISMLATLEPAIGHGASDVSIALCHMLRRELQAREHRP